MLSFDKFGYMKNFVPTVATI